MSIIEVANVTKEYQLGQFRSLKQTVLNSVRRLTGQPIEGRKPFKALDDVSFTVQEGEVVGIIGHNGAGKSTLLKILAHISTPTSGHLRVSGRIAPLIEVGAGFVPDLTGRENVYLNGSILGLSKKEITRNFDQIVDFAEIAEFIDTPVKRYSSGMQVKLAFAVATSVESEILIVDEVLAVGDLAFQRKCFDRMEDLINRQGRTVLLVSHNIRQVERLCSRVLLMNHGHVLHDGPPQEVCNAFYEQNDARILNENAKSAGNLPTRHMSSGEIELVNISIRDQLGTQIQEVEYGSTITISISLKVNRPITKPIFGIGVHTTDFLYLATNHNTEFESPTILPPGIHEILCRIEDFPFLPRTYNLRFGAMVGEKRHTAFYVENAYAFSVVAAQISRAHPDNSEGFIALKSHWEIGDAASYEAPQLAIEQH